MSPHLCIELKPGAKAARHVSLMHRQDAAPETTTVRRAGWSHTSKMANERGEKQP